MISPLNFFHFYVICFLQITCLQHLFMYELYQVNVQMFIWKNTVTYPFSTVGMAQVLVKKYCEP